MNLTPTETKGLEAIFDEAGQAPQDGSAEAFETTLLDAMFLGSEEAPAEEEAVPQDAGSTPTPEAGSRDAGSAPTLEAGSQDPGTELGMLLLREAVRAQTGAKGEASASESREIGRPRSADRAGRGEFLPPHAQGQGFALGRNEITRDRGASPEIGRPIQPGAASSASTGQELTAAREVVATPSAPAPPTTSEGLGTDEAARTGAATLAAATTTNPGARLEVARREPTAPTRIDASRQGTSTEAASETSPTGTRDAVAATSASADAERGASNDLPDERFGFERSGAPSQTGTSMAFNGAEASRGAAVSSAANSSAANPGAAAAATASPATGTDAPATTTQPQPVEAIPQHVELLASRGGGTARLRLHPASLGEVEITVTTRGGSVDVIIRAEEPAAQAAVLANREQLAEALGSRDLKMDGFSVGSDGRSQGEGENPFHAGQDRREPSESGQSLATRAEAGDAERTAELPAPVSPEAARSTGIDLRV